jgi:hypothetical protein
LSNGRWPAAIVSLDQLDPAGDVWTERLVGPDRNYASGTIYRYFKVESVVWFSPTFVREDSRMTSLATLIHCLFRTGGSAGRRGHLALIAVQHAIAPQKWTRARVQCTQTCGNYIFSLKNLTLFAPGGGMVSCASPPGQNGKFAIGRDRDRKVSVPLDTPPKAGSRTQRCRCPPGREHLYLQRINHSASI